MATRILLSRFAFAFCLGLEPGCSYCAQLRARNQRGWGAWSRWSAPRSPGAVPGRPPAPRAPAQTHRINYSLGIIVHLKMMVLKSLDVTDVTISGFAALFG